MVRDFRLGMLGALWTGAGTRSVGHLRVKDRSVLLAASASHTIASILIFKFHLRRVKFARCTSSHLE